MSNIVSFPRCKLLIRPLEILFMVNVLLFTAWRITQYVRLKNKSGCQLFLVIGLFIYVLARGHFSRPHLYPLSATNRIRSAIIELNRTRRKPSVLKVSLFSSLLIVSPSLSVKTNDNLRLDWIPLNFFFSLSISTSLTHLVRRFLRHSILVRVAQLRRIYIRGIKALYTKDACNCQQCTNFLMPGWVTSFSIVEEFIIIFKVLNVTRWIAFWIVVYGIVLTRNLQHVLYFCWLEFHICNYWTPIFFLEF